jgi:hypothetical protein
MKPAIKKAVSAKTMRVTTVFTGAAACVAALTPAAATAVGQHAVARPGNRIGLDAAMFGARPDLNPVLCGGAGTSNDAQFETRSTVRYCFGDRGIWAVSRHKGFRQMWQMCGGNNWGSYAGYTRSGTGGFVDAEFGQGTTWVHLPWNGYTSITEVLINGWAGSHECGHP